MLAKYAIMKGQTSCGTLNHQFLFWILLEVNFIYTVLITNAPTDNFVYSSDFHELLSECIRTLSMATSKSFYNENHS